MSGSEWPVAGAQPAETFTRALEQARESRVPSPLVPLGAEAVEACGPDGCEPPRR
ncbi:hypothetical protein [Kitasatospora aureofaciens]|uniref:hypothetical protein n=1 Tax=Kitasatospora aureofaciens TaxID=1894 RepID=UPI0033E3D025